MTEVPVRTDIDPNAHPAALSAYAASLDMEGTTGSASIAIGREVLTEVYRAIGDLNDAQDSFLKAAKGERRMVNGRAVISRLPSEELINAANTRMGKVTKLVDSRVATLEQQRAALEQKVQDVLDDPSLRSPFGAEVRGHFKAQKRSFTAVADAIQSGDRLSVAEVLRAPAYLSGLSQKEHDTLRKLAAHQFAPVEARQAEAVAGMVDHIKRASGGLLQAYGKVIENRDAPAVVASRKIKDLAG